MAEVTRGDEAAFADLFRRYAPIANGLAIRLLGSRTLAEDVLQEVFLSLWRGSRSYDAGRGTVRSWLLAQIHHRAVDVIRREEAERRRLQKEALPDFGDEIDDVVEQSWTDARRDHVRAALSSLSDGHRSILELAYFGGLTQAQIAERTHTPLGTVKSRTLGAMRAMRAALQGVDR